MKIRFATSRKSKIIVAALVCAFAVSAHAAEDKAKEQNEIRKNVDKILQKLYKAQPASKTAVQNAAGYAVFSNMGLKILFCGVR